MSLFNAPTQLEVSQYLANYATVGNTVVAIGMFFIAVWALKATNAAAPVKKWAATFALESTALRA